jgi:hypothetical protein
VNKFTYADLSVFCKNRDIFPRYTIDSNRANHGFSVGTGGYQYGAGAGAGAVRSRNFWPKPALEPVYKVSALAPAPGSGSGSN